MGVARAREPEVTDYLDERELRVGSYVYDRLLLPVTLLRTGETAQAWCYVAKPDHEQYAGDLDDAAVLEHVRDSHGSAGACADYVRNTVAHLREMGISEPRLEALVGRLGADG
jgi:cation transport protein ChaC